jgi:hypothetical protein
MIQFLYLILINGLLCRQNFAKKDIASTRFTLDVYSKDAKENVIYKIKKVKLITTDYVEDVEELIIEPYADTVQYNENKKVPSYAQSTYIRTRVFGGKFEFQRPKDMKFSMDIEVEVDNNGEITSYQFSYDFSFTMKDHWFVMMA